MIEKIFVVFLILSIHGIDHFFGNLALLDIAFAKMFEIVSFYYKTVFLIKLFFPCNKFEMIRESIKSMYDMIMKDFEDFN